jgi:hypothetical protein
VNRVGPLQRYAFPAGIAMRYDRCSRTLFSAICIAATVVFWFKLALLVLHKS